MLFSAYVLTTFSCVNVNDKKTTPHIAIQIVVHPKTTAVTRRSIFLDFICWFNPFNNLQTNKTKKIINPIVITINIPVVTYGRQQSPFGRKANNSILQ